jgi:hypothetical protein
MEKVRDNAKEAKSSGEDKKLVILSELVEDLLLEILLFVSCNTTDLEV